ncbi:hypothetical protein VitviT2T_017933 [Vitis vinifera]|uniref:Uncharacterized protein n=1 Tax=Vitis vinifera TaxID=29760 RepID=A0ABY9CY99_VITVI|nr:hypothetical protein VitviT2T_017933 [Vitis vinifera]
MKGKAKVELWREAVSELRKSVPYIKGVEKKVFLPLKWSYDSLQAYGSRCLVQSAKGLEHIPDDRTWQSLAIMDNGIIRRPDHALQCSRHQFCFYKLIFTLRRCQRDSQKDR